MIEPGTTCPTCERRVPHPKKETSPLTSVICYRAPVDEKDAHLETRENVARFLGTYERPHWQFWTTSFGFAAVLQDESLRGAGQRSVLA